MGKWATGNERFWGKGEDDGVGEGGLDGDGGGIKSEFVGVDARGIICCAL